MVKAGEIAQEGVKSAYGKPAKYTYAVGTSNGGYQVRRALETAPKVFDGGVDWEGTFVDEEAPNLLTDLPPAVLNCPGLRRVGIQSGQHRGEEHRRRRLPARHRAAGDPGASRASLWGNYSNSFWEVTQCQWQKRLDPAYDTYGAAPAPTTTRSGARSRTSARTWPTSPRPATSRSRSSRWRARWMRCCRSTTMRAPMRARSEARARRRTARPGDDKKHPAYRLYEVQNGNHIETYQDAFPQLELIMPHAQKAFDLLVQQVEQKVALPPSQCIPRGGAIAAAPAQPGHCAQLFVP